MVRQTGVLGVGAAGALGASATRTQDAGKTLPNRPGFAATDFRWSYFLSFAWTGLRLVIWAWWHSQPSLADLIARWTYAMRQWRAAKVCDS
jgi:hypothetical protein